MGTRKPNRIAADQAIDIMLEEYRAMYSIASFRLQALERRVPTTAGSVVAAIAGIAVLPEPSQLVIVLVIPALAFWLFQTTLNHARSFEDAIRRIDQIEIAVNGRAGTALLRFQSTHPSRGKAIGGRTGQVTTLVVLFLSYASLVLCALSIYHMGHVYSGIKLGLVAYLLAVGILMMFMLQRLQGYKY